jgi:SAM-dependent methyltransferase
MPLDARDAHLRRDRAESFGAVAEDYDRYRPGYPAGLISDLVALRPRSVLDVGCGTGKAARLLAASGLRVLGVEVDPKMAAVARTHGLDVEVGAFEQWADNGRTFDLITCAQAWHWVDPVAGAAKAARVLTPGGRLALFWNYGDVDDTTRAALDEVYDRLAPELRDLHGAGAQAPQDSPYADQLRVSGRFGPVSTRTYPWQRDEPVQRWVARLGTQSDHLTLGGDVLRALLHGVQAALLGLGPTVTTTGGTYLVLAPVA